MESATQWMWHVPQPSSTYLNQFAPSEQGPCMGGATSLCRYFHAPSYPLIFTWELHVDAKSTQYTELTVLSPSMFWHVEGQDPPIHKRGVGIKRTGEEIEASYHSGLPAVGCPTAFEVYSKSQLLPSCSWVHLKTFKNFFVHFGCTIGGRIYYNMDHLYFCIYLFITRPQPQSSFSPSTSLCL